MDRCRPFIAVLMLGVYACGSPDPATDDGDAGSPPTDSAIPVVHRTIEVFFTLGDTTVAVERSDPVQPAGDPAADARPALEPSLRALLRGPTAEERTRGLTSWFSAETADLLLGVELDAAGHAIVDFTGLPAVIPNASSSAGSEQLLEQLYGTLFQFPEVRSAEYRLDGSCEAFWNWIQRGCTIVRREGGAGVDDGGPGG